MSIYYIPGERAPQCETNMVKILMLGLTKNGFSRQGINVEWGKMKDWNKLTDSLRTIF